MTKEQAERILRKRVAARLGVYLSAKHRRIGTGLQIQSVEETRAKTRLNQAQHELDELLVAR